MAQIVAGFGVPHTPIFPHFVKRDGPDCEIAKLFGAQKQELAAARPDVIVMFDTDHLNTFFLNDLPIFAVGVDKVSLAGIYSSFAEVQAHMVQNGTDSAIDLGQGDFVVFQHVAMNAFTAGDFLF